ncbi:cell division protein FtsZ, partial [Candidatus Bathyarchaeota archaeon]|nr:cell division protein FtsZ [Candidatus Bathyarchaeota archaeon]
MQKIDLEEHELEEIRKQRFILKEQERIEQLARISKPSVVAVGIGGAGCNVVTWVKEKGVAGGRLIAVNTDANHLAITEADRKILIGEKTCKGLGCGGYPEVGERAMRESVGEVLEEIADANIIFLVAGMGGGTGTGATIALAEELRRRTSSNIHQLLVGVVTLPFEIETARMEIAKKGIQRLKEVCDTVVLIDNNKLVKLAGNLPFREALGVANTTVGKFIKGVTETITTASLINIDFADLRAIMTGAGLASLGVGEGRGDGKVEQAVERALNGRLLDVEDVTKARGLLLHVSGGEDLTLQEVHQAGELIKRSIPPKAKIVWGARVS